MYKKISSLIIILVLTFGLVFSAWGADLLSEIQKRGELRIGTYLQYPPIMFRDPITREPKGSDVEIGELIAKDMGVKVKYFDKEFRALIPGLLAAEFDIIIATVAITPQRALSVEFSIPYTSMDNILLVKQNSPIKSLAQGVKELNKPGKKISVVMGGVSEFAARRFFPKADLKLLDTATATLQVESGLADAQVTQVSNALSYTKEHKTLRIVGIGEEPLGRQPAGIAVRSGEQKLLNWLNNWIIYRQLRGDLDEIHERWGVKMRSR